MLVVKANAYGLGAIEISRFVEDIDFVSYLGVATGEEALSLRQNHIKKPILILGYGLNYGFERLIEDDVSFCIYDYGSAKTISDTAKALGKTAKIHIKLDTGMSRIGFFNNAYDMDTIEKICKLDNINAEGVFSHFARADEENADYTLMQIDEFKSCIALLKKRGIEFKIKHCSNSAGILQYRQANFNMVRSGCMAYGMAPSPFLESSISSFKPVLSLESTVVFVKCLPEDRFISYGGTYLAKRGTKIATIALGYADGYPRALSNKGLVLINGVSCPIIGNVCMDQMMIDASDVNDIKIGDRVTIIGENGDKKITMEDLALLAGRINYELICGIGDRVQREYIVG